MRGEETMSGLGLRLRQAREDAGLTQAQTAKLLGLHRSAISEVESEERKVTAAEAKTFAEIYHVSLDWLLGEPPDVKNKVRLAARKLEGLRDSDLDTVMRIIDSFRKSAK